MSCLITLFFITLCLCDEVAAFPILLPDTKFADSHDTQVGGGHSLVYPLNVISLSILVLFTLYPVLFGSVCAV